jgi:hypothetical protein
LDNVYDKVLQGFTVIGKELNDPAIVAENVYNTVYPLVLDSECI